jgi:hypothetical protein
MKYESSAEIELAIARWFGIRTHVMVPNLSWGFLNYECDIAVLSANNYLYEIEIKISKQDLLRDKAKQKWRTQNQSKIRKLWFAIPTKLMDAIIHIPVDAGILVVNQNGSVTQIRKPITNLQVKAVTENDRYKLARLGAIRVWSLKQKLLKQKRAA